MGEGLESFFFLEEMFGRKGSLIFRVKIVLLIYSFKVGVFRSWWIDLVREFFRLDVRFL